MRHPRNLAEDVRHAHGEGDGAAGAVHQVFRHFLFEGGQVDHGHAESGELVRRGVDGEVVGGHEHAGGDQGHDRDEALNEHGAVADEQDVAFLADHLGRGARADGGVEARERAAGDGDEDERDHRAAHDGAAALGELGERGHVEIGHDEHDAERQRADGADLEEGGQVVAGQEQQPHRQDRGDEAVHRNQDGHGLLVDVQPAEDIGMRRHVGPGQDAQAEQRHADDRRAEHVALAPYLHVQAHDHGDRNGRRHGVGGPQAVVHGVDHRDGQARQRQQQNGEYGPRRHAAGRLVDFLRGDVGEALSPVAHRGEQHDHVVHAAREHAADENPQQAGHVAELGRQHGAEQGARRGDGGEVVAEQDVLVGVHVVVPVGVLDGGRRPRVVQVQDLVGDEQTVKPVADGENA